MYMNSLMSKNCYLLICLILGFGILSLFFVIVYVWSSVVKLVESWYSLLWIVKI